MCLVCGVLHVAGGPLELQGLAMACLFRRQLIWVPKAAGLLTAQTECHLAPQALGKSSLLDWSGSGLEKFSTKKCSFLSPGEMGLWLPPATISY